MYSYTDCMCFDICLCEEPLDLCYFPVFTHILLSISCVFNTSLIRHVLLVMLSGA